MIDELIASILVPLMTEDGDPPEDVLEYPSEKTESDEEQEPL